MNFLNLLMKDGDELRDKVASSERCEQQQRQTAERRIPEMMVLLQCGHSFDFNVRPMCPLEAAVTALFPRSHPKPCSSVCFGVDYLMGLKILSILG